MLSYKKNVKNPQNQMSCVLKKGNGIDVLFIGNGFFFFNVLRGWLLYSYFLDRQQPQFTVQFVNDVNSQIQCFDM